MAFLCQDVKRLILANNALYKENQMVKREYSKLSFQFNEILSLCNNMVTSLEQRQEMSKSVDNLTFLADNLNDDIDLLTNCFSTKQIEDVEDDNASTCSSIYYDALDFDVDT